MRDDAETCDDSKRPVRDLEAILASLEPVLHPGVYVYCKAPSDWTSDEAAPLFTFREAEGLTVVLEESEARRAALASAFRAAWITLQVHSDLEAVGLTAAVAGALADAGISCNVVAAFHHDHLFVPVERGEEALNVLRMLQQASIR